MPTCVAPDADLRTDVPRYRIYRHGELVEEPTNLHAWWRNDLVAFLLGCSFTFLDPVEGAPASAVGELVVGALDDVTAAERAAKGAAVVTYEWEGVPATTTKGRARN